MVLGATLKEIVIQLKEVDCWSFTQIQEEQRFGIDRCTDLVDFSDKNGELVS